MSVIKNDTPTLDKFRAIEAELESANDRLHHLLDRLGWRYTSKTPGCVWMFEKKIPDGRTILCNATLAQAFEEELCGEEYEE